MSFKTNFVAYFPMRVCVCGGGKISLLTSATGSVLCHHGSSVCPQLYSLDLRESKFHIPVSVRFMWQLKFRLYDSCVARSVEMEPFCATNMPGLHIYFLFMLIALLPLTMVMHPPPKQEASHAFPPRQRQQHQPRDTPMLSPG